MSLTTSDFLSGLMLPGILLFHAVQAYTYTLLDALLHQQPLSTVRGKAFGRFWTKISGAPDDPSVPLVGSATLVPPLLSQARGVVLDVGPGSGNLTGYFEPAAANISRIYGAEPATELHKLLRKNVDGTNLSRKYTVLGADATQRSIAKELVRQGVIAHPEDAHDLFDTILCIRVLCSVPDLNGTIEDLYTMLRPGGKLLICEHTANPWRTPKGSLIARLVQTFYMLLGWSYFVGDCSLTRDIEDALKKDTARRWQQVDIERHFGQVVLTYIAGVLVKN